VTFSRKKTVVAIAAAGQGNNAIRPSPALPKVLDRGSTIAYPTFLMHSIILVVYNTE
jgi:hypothetical protein